MNEMVVLYELFYFYLFCMFTAHPCKKTRAKIASQHSGIIVHALGSNPALH